LTNYPTYCVCPLIINAGVNKKKLTEQFLKFPKGLNLQSFLTGQMKKCLFISILALAIISMLPVINSSYAQNATSEASTFHGDVDASPIEAIIMINEDQNKTAFFQPNVVTISVGGEILIANNATSDHSVTSGSGPNDPMLGKMFDTGVIKPRAFVEYVTENLAPGNYSFFSTIDPQIKGTMIVVAPK
jgi:plastocyanin